MLLQIDAQLNDNSGCLRLWEITFPLLWFYCGPMKGEHRISSRLERCKGTDYCSVAVTWPQHCVTRWWSDCAIVLKSSLSAPLCTNSCAACASVKGANNCPEHETMTLLMERLSVALTRTNPLSFASYTILFFHWKSWKITCCASTRKNMKDQMFLATWELIAVKGRQFL